MTDNEILARWQGWRLNPACGWINPNETNKYKTETKVPDYPNDDSAAMSLLDTLVDKGFKPMLTYYTPRWHFHYNYIYGHDGEDNGYPSCFIGKTRREAIVAACLKAHNENEITRLVAPKRRTRHISNINDYYTACCEEHPPTPS